MLIAVLVPVIGCSTAKKYPGPIHGQTFYGTLKLIDLKERRLLIRGANAGEPGEPAVFVWDEYTKFWKNDFPIHSNELEVGWSVRVHYHVASGQMHAHHVHAQLPYKVVH